MNRQNSSNSIHISIFFLFIFLVKIKLGATIKYVVGNQKFTMDNTAQLFCGKMTSLPSFNLASQTRYKGPTLYLVFLVIVIAILAMFAFQFCPKLQDKHCKEHYDYDRENQMQSPSLNKHRTGKLGATFQLKTTGTNVDFPTQADVKHSIFYTYFNRGQMAETLNPKTLKN